MDCVDAYVQIADWDANKVRDKLRRDIDAHAAALRSEKLTEISTEYEVKRLELHSSLEGLIYFRKCR